MTSVAELVSDDFEYNREELEKLFALKRGRPFKYDESYVDKVLEYLSRPLTVQEPKEVVTKDGVVTIYETVANEMPTAAGFRRENNISSSTYKRWRDRYPDFNLACEGFRDAQKEFLVQNTLRGKYNPAMSIFLCKNLFGWKDKQEISGSDGKPMFNLVIQAPDFKKDE